MSRKQWGHGFHAGVQSVNGTYRGKTRCLSADKAILCWNPGTSQVRVFEFPPPDGFYGRWAKYEMTTLADSQHFCEMTFEQRKAAVFIEAMHIVVRDKCSPMAVHLALLEVQEYRDGCALDMPGI
jgi:hypothetical protein